MATKSQPIDRFEETLAPFLPDFKSLDVRAVATSMSIGYVFENIRIVLEPSTGRGLHVDLPKLDRVLAVHEKWDIGRMSEILGMLRRSEFRIGNTLIHLKKLASPDKWIPLDGIHHRAYTRNEANTRFGMDSYCLSLEAHESHYHEGPDLKKIDDALLCENAPWDGIHDLKTTFARQSRTWHPEVSFLEIIAPIGVRFGGTLPVDRGHLTLTIKASHGIDVSKMSVACMAKSDNTITRCQLAPRKAKAAKGLLRYQTRVALPSMHEWIKCVLVYRGLEVDRHELLGAEHYNSSPRLRTFSEITGGFEKYGDLPSGGQQLEAHLEVLFHTLGFYTAHYGGRSWPTSKPTPDIIAFPKNGDWFIVIECTSREPSLHDKLGKLSTRSRELSKATRNCKAYPVLFTALSRDSVSTTDLEKASKEQISIITQDDMPFLLEAARLGKKNDETLRLLLRNVPGEI